MTWDWVSAGCGFLAGGLFIMLAVIGFLVSSARAGLIAPGRSLGRGKGGGT